MQRVGDQPNWPAYLMSREPNVHPWVTYEDDQLHAHIDNSVIWKMVQYHPFEFQREARRSRKFGTLAGIQRQNSERQLPLI